MIKKSVLKRFVRPNIAPYFPDFQLYQGPHLVRICRPLLHGIVFEPAGKDDFYTTCFVHFLTIRDDFMGIGSGERIFRIDKPGQTHRIEPAKEETAKLMEAIWQSPFSPFNLWLHNPHGVFTHLSTEEMIGPANARRPDPQDAVGGVGYKEYAQEESNPQPSDP